MARAPFLAFPSERVAPSYAIPGYQGLATLLLARISLGFMKWRARVSWKAHFQHTSSDIPISEPAQSAKHAGRSGTAPITCTFLNCLTKTGSTDIRPVTSSIQHMALVDSPGPHSRGPMRSHSIRYFVLENHPMPCVDWQLSKPQCPLWLQSGMGVLWTGQKKALCLSFFESLQKTWAGEEVTKSVNLCGKRAFTDTLAGHFMGI